MLDKLDSQGDFLNDKIKAALHQKKKEEISWKYYLADRVTFYHARNYIFQNLD